jgi:very-long-chain (3R)-3-hydroxyacyl-CoA dehydratase
VLATLLSVPLPRLWSSVGGSLKAVQTVASIMEILHVSLGWVSSSLLTNVMQALARHMSLWLVVDLNFSIAHSSSSVMDQVVGVQWNTKEVWLGATVAAWAAVEVVRYSMYVTEQVGATPSLLRFLRYNAFIVLYPLGFVGEVCGLLLALQSYKSGLCPPLFPQCTSNSIGLYIAYFYLFTAVPG